MFFEVTSKFLCVGGDWGLPFVLCILLFLLAVGFGFSLTFLVHLCTYR